MTPAEFIQKRKADWDELDQITQRWEYKRREADPATILRFGSLYRSVCTDLSVASSFRLPGATMSRLDRLVSRAHGALYAARSIRTVALLRYVLAEIPAAIRKDRLVLFCVTLFYAVFFATTALGYFAPAFAHEVVGPAALQSFEEMHSGPKTSPSAGDVAAGSGFYIMNNASISLTCFGLGILGGIGSLYIMLYNAVFLGSVIGYLLTTPAAEGILAWLPVHAPIELTAIGISSGAGMRMGLALVLAGNRPRLQALQEGARSAIPIIVGAALLTFIAAFLEAFFAPAALPLLYKYLAGLLLLGLLLAYLSGAMARPLPQT